MKYIKKFEAKRIRTVPVDNRSALEKMRKEWEEIEDRSPWDFDYFWTKIFTYSNGSEFQEFCRDFERDKSNNGCEPHLNMEYYDPSYGADRTKNPEFAYDVEWKKRNGSIKIMANTGGASGGSCYDEGIDDGARSYETYYSVETESFISLLKNVLYGIFGRARNPSGIGDVEKIASLIQKTSDIKDDTYTNNEYYGNYDDYSYITISLWDLYKFLVLNDFF